VVRGRTQGARSCVSLVLCLACGCSSSAASRGAAPVATSTPSADVTRPSPSARPTPAARPSVSSTAVARVSVPPKSLSPSPATGVPMTQLHGRFSLASDITVVLAVRPPRGENIEGLHVGSRYVTWAGGPPNKYHYTNTGYTDDNLHQLDVLDRATVRLQIIASHRPDAFITPVPSSGNWVLWIEQVPHPSSACGQDLCMTWTLYARNMGTSQERVIDRSDVPRSGVFFVPRITANDGYVAWMRASATNDRVVEVVTTRLDGGAQKVVFRGSGGSQLSISQGRVYFDRVGSDGKSALAAVGLDGGTVHDFRVGTDVQHPNVIGAQGVWITGHHPNAMSVEIADLGAATPRPRSVLNTVDGRYYWVARPRPDHLYVQSSNGTELVKQARTNPKVEEMFPPDTQYYAGGFDVGVADEFVYAARDPQQSQQRPTAIVLASPR
jgi:hypothetical protein